MGRKLSYHFIKTSKTFIDKKSTKEQYRMTEKDFTRNRKLPFEALVLCMLKLLRRNLQLELNSFFASLTSTTKSITSSAFVQSRKKLKADLFYDLNKLIVSEYYTDNQEVVELFKGHRLLAIDGSTVQLPLTEELKSLYGTFNNQHKTDDIIVGRVSVLYDVLNDIVLDGLLTPLDQGELTLSREHMKLTKKGDLIIMDRAYPSFESIYWMLNQGVDFLYRCKQNFSKPTKAFFDSGKNEAIVSIKPSQSGSFKDLPYRKDTELLVRFLRIELESGEIEILMSSLLNKQDYPYTDFKSLYFKRWQVEIFYNRFKNIIAVESFSGTTNQFIQQEFNCALYMSNMQTILTQEAKELIDEKYKRRKYEYKVNTSLSLGFIRERLIEIYSSSKEPKDLLEELQQLFVKNVVPVRKGRKNKRKVDKFRRRTKPKQFKNRRLIL